MLSRCKKWAYGFNQFGINLLWQAFNTVDIFYYVTVLHVSGESLSIGMIFFGVVSSFFNFLAGHLSDRTNTRFGRRIPYILFASLPLALLFLLLFHPVVSHGYLIYYFVVTILFDLAFTVTALNIGALYPEMYQTKSDRAYVSALQQFFGILGMIIGVALAKSMGQILGWGTMGMVFAIVGAISLYVSLFGCFENPLYRETSLQLKEAIAQTLKNKRFVVYVLASLLIQLVTTMFVSLSSFYTKYVVTLSAMQSAMFLGSLFVVAIPMAFVWAKIAVKTTAIRATILATFLYGVIALLFLFDYSPMMIIVTGALLGIPVAGFLVLLNVLLAEVIDFDARYTGKRREGMYLGMNGFIVRIGMSLQYAIMAVFFSVSHFNSAVQNQPVSAIDDLRILIGGLPILLLLVAFLLLHKFQHYSNYDS